MYMSVDVAPEQARKLNSAQTLGLANVPQSKADSPEKVLRLRPYYRQGRNSSEMYIR